MVPPSGQREWGGCTTLLLMNTREIDLQRERAVFHYWIRHELDQLIKGDNSSKRLLLSICHAVLQLT